MNNIFLVIIGIIFVLFGVISLFSKKSIIKVISYTVLIIDLFIALIYGTSDILNKTNYGLDLQGGFEVLYEVEPLEEETLNSEKVLATYKTILKRVDVLGVSEPEITIEGENRIRIRLAGVTNQEEAREILSKPATLTFRDTSDNLLMTSDVLEIGKVSYITDQYGLPAVSLPIKDINKFYNVTNEISNSLDKTIVIWLDFETGKDSFKNEELSCGSLTSSKCLSAARVEQAFSSDVIITGSFTKEEATNLSELINSGSMPTKLNELSSRTVEASFGEKSLDKTLFAGLIGIILIILIMIIIYRFSGIIASFSIVLYTFLTFLIFYLLDGVLTLPGIAAILLGIGMAVDSAVISMERIKDELKGGLTLKDAFVKGNKTSLSSIIDANITTLIVAIILFIFGESSIKGFATMLIISIITTILVMVFLNRLVLKIFVKTNYFDNKLRLFTGIRKKDINKKKEPFKRLEFVKNKKIFFTLTILIILVFSLITFLGKGFNFGIDFKGGTNITVLKQESLKLEDIETDLKELGYTVAKKENNSDVYSIVIEEILTKDDINKVTNEISSKYNTTTDISVVSKIVKEELIKNGLYSLIFATIGIIIYISIRFKINYAIAAIIAIIHDCIIVILFFGTFYIEITTIFIAAILTIIGYSINDTIVTFDRIRENYKNIYENNIKDEKMLETLVNLSVRETFFRTILTTLTTLCPIITLIIFGAFEIINFNIALLVGFIAGVYSSIYISNQIWLMLESKRIKKGPKKSYDDDEPNELLIKGINS